MNTPQQIITRVEGVSESATKISLKSGKFQMTIDEPEQMGGTNEGPTPMQVMFFVLAGCINMTSQFIAKEKGIKLKGLKVEISGGMNPMKFMGMEKNIRAGFDNVNVKLIPDFDGFYDDKLLAEWIKETEERCPVTDNIKDKTKISIEISGRDLEILKKTPLNFQRSFFIR